MCHTIKQMLDGARPVDQIMLVIEFLILVFILWEFAWKVWDWLRFTNSIKAVDSSGVIAASLAAMSASYSFLFLRSFSNKQPPDQCALSLQGKVLLIGRDFVGWYVSLEHRDYLRRWAKRKITSRR